MPEFNREFIAVLCVAGFLAIIFAHLLIRNSIEKRAQRKMLAKGHRWIPRRKLLDKKKEIMRCPHCGKQKVGTHAFGVSLHTINILKCKECQYIFVECDPGWFSKGFVIMSREKYAIWQKERLKRKK